MLFVSFWYSRTPTYPATRAKITSSDPMITDVRDSLGSLRLRMSKMVLNSGYLPSRRYPRIRPD